MTVHQNRHESPVRCISAWRNIRIMDDDRGADSTDRVREEASMGSVRRASAWLEVAMAHRRRRLDRLAGPLATVSRKIGLVCCLRPASICKC